MMIASAGCAQQSFESQELRYTIRGGSLPRTETLMIKGDSAHFQFQGRDGEDYTTHVAISHAEKKALLDLLAANKFTKIREAGKLQHDRPSTIISLPGAGVSKMMAEALWRQTSNAGIIWWPLLKILSRRRNCGNKG